MPAASIADFRAQARRRLPHFLFEYIDGGSYDEVTLRANRHDLGELALRQRVLKNVENVSTTTDLFGDSCSMPVALAPVGLAGINRRRGEALAARAARGRRLCQWPPQRERRGPHEEGRCDEGLRQVATADAEVRKKNG